MWTQSNRTERFTMRMFLFFLIGVLAAARALAADPQIPISIRDPSIHKADVTAISKRRIAADAPKLVCVRITGRIPHEIPVPAGTKIELVIKNEQAERTSLHREKIIPDGGQISVFVGPLGPGV
jgi:hypothetical protein